MCWMVSYAWFSSISPSLWHTRSLPPTHAHTHASHLPPRVNFGIVQLIAPDRSSSLTDLWSITYTGTVEYGATDARGPLCRFLELFLCLSLLSRALPLKLQPFQPSPPLIYLNSVRWLHSAPLSFLVHTCCTSRWKTRDSHGACCSFLSGITVLGWRSSNIWKLWIHIFYSVF